MRRKLARLASALLLTLTTPSGVLALAGDKKPEELLKDRGLARAGSVYILEAESDFISKVTALKPSYGNLRTAFLKVATMNQAQAEYDALDDQWTLATEQLRNVQAEQDVHPATSNNELKASWQALLEAERQLRLQCSALRREVNLRYKRLPSNAEKEEAQADFLKKCKDFVESSREPQQQLTKLKGEYASLVKDGEVTKALETLKKSTKGGMRLGPSAEFKKASAYLLDAVKSTSPESLTPKNSRRGARTTARGKNAARANGTSTSQPEKSVKKAPNVGNQSTGEPKKSND